MFQCNQAEFKHSFQRDDVPDQIGKSQNGPLPEIMVLGDIFRLASSTNNKWIWRQQQNILWLSRIVAGGLASRQGIQVNVLDHKALALKPENFGPDREQDFDLWWASQISNEINDDLKERLVAAVTGRVIVGFEIPNNIASLIERHAYALIRIEISPLRFMDDVLLRVWSNNALIAEAINISAVSEREMYWAAGVFRAQMHDTGLATQWNLRRACLLVGQTEHDRSVVSYSEFLSLANYVDKIRTLSSEYDLVIFSPHPMDHDPSANLRYLVDVPGVRVSVERPYRLLEAGVVTRLASISSSLLSEARYFNVEAIRLGPVDEDVPFVNVRVQALGEAVADSIADVLRLPLPPLVRGTLLSSPIVRQTLVGDWSLQGLDRTDHPLPCLTINDWGGWYTPDHEDFTKALVHGWYQLEAWGVWSRSIGVLGLDWPDQREATVTCVLELRSLAANMPTQTINVWSNGTKISQFAVPNGEIITAAFTVPPCRRPGPVQIWLECGQSLQPSAIQPGHADTRLLGVGLSGIKIG